MKKLLLFTLTLSIISFNINANTVTFRSVAEKLNNAVSAQLGFFKNFIAQKLQTNNAQQANTEALTQQEPTRYNDLSSIRDSIQDVITDALPQEPVSVKQMNASLKKYLDAQYPHQKLFDKHAHFPAQEHQKYCIQYPHFWNTEEIDFIRKKRINEIQLNEFYNLLDEGNKAFHARTLIQEKKWDALTDEELQLIEKYRMIQERKNLQESIFNHVNFDHSQYTEEELKNLQSPRASLVMLSLIKNTLDMIEPQSRATHIDNPATTKPRA